MARHRSPQGQCAHLRFPLPQHVAADTGGVLRSSVSITISIATLKRAAAVTIAGSTVAAVGQVALNEALPAASDADNLLRLSMQKLVGTTSEGGGASRTADVDPTSTVIPAGVGSAMAPVLAEPQIADVGDLVKAAELRRHTGAATSVTTAPTSRFVVPPAEPRTVGEPQVRLPVKPKPSGAAVTSRGGVQLVTGRVTSGFGLRWNAQHRGLDIAAPIGTPIRVPLAGTVIDSGPASGFGLWVRVRHADGTVTLYGHINRSLVRVGEEVTAGQVIAEVGNRGRSTGPHLHIEVITPSGNNVNPVPWLSERAISY